MSLIEEAKSALDLLGEKNRAFSAHYPGETSKRQPVHTVYGGAQLYRADTTKRLGELALDSLKRHGDSAFAFAEAVGVVAPGELSVDESAARAALSHDALTFRRSEPRAWLALSVFERVKKKLAHEAVEDFRIDFEDGFGARSDAEEDATAKSAASELAQAVKRGIASPFIGIRIKSFGEEWKLRGARTLELFIDTLLAQTGGALPDNFVVTLPKVQIAEQAATLVSMLELLERRHGLAPKSLQMEIMIEVTQALLGVDGRSPLPAFLRACEGRCVGAHLGTYDFTASCNVTAAYQTMDHRLCDIAKAMMTFAYAGTGVFLSDGATNVMPVEIHRGAALTPEQEAENRAAVESALRTAYRHVRHSLVNGFYQGWDLHPAQLPVRYAACYAFFLEGLEKAEERLRNFVEKAAQATLLGEVFDDAATGQGLLNFFLRALNSGAIDLDEAAQTGLTRDEFALRSFARILEARRARTSA